MVRYKPDSWTAQAREMANSQIEAINYCDATIFHATQLFSHSYRHWRIRYRAAKRFGRELRLGHIHETVYARQKEKEYFKEYSLTSYYN